MHHFNRTPDPVFRSLDALRAEMTRVNPEGDAFLDFLLAGDYFDGKGVWINQRAEVRSFYDEMLAASPNLASESPYGSWFRSKGVRTQGENRVLLRRMSDAPPDHHSTMHEHLRLRASGSVPSSAVFVGGPAAKIAAIITASGAKTDNLSVTYVLDGAEQSNESGSASYEHVNHANALNAEHDNTGLGILFSALARAVVGEPDPAVALGHEYRKVDLWPRAVRFRDLPIFVGNEIHGWLQRLKALVGLLNDHTKSRLASKASTQILSFIEKLHQCSFRLDNSTKRAIFLYFTNKQYALSRRDNEELRASVGLRPESLTEGQLAAHYGDVIPSRVFAGDVFPENACIRHGFDGICRSLLVSLGARDLHRFRLKEVYVDAPSGGSDRELLVRGVALENCVTAETTCVPADYLVLSLGPTATFHYAKAETLAHRIKDALGVGQPVPHQTIATGFSAQVLFRITDPNRAAHIPHTGMKQTHFVEIGRTGSHVLMKLTCGGMIGLPVYSRSYGISAMASLLRIITPGMGLQFEDVVCAWPCARGVNPSNNGQAIRLADNAACRFGEGGTGMSKMGTNAQSLLDLAGLPWPFPQDLRLDHGLYRHTVIDRRRVIRRRMVHS